MKVLPLLAVCWKNALLICRPMEADLSMIEAKTYNSSQLLSLCC